jgi:hypothetical protein
MRFSAALSGSPTAVITGCARKYRRLLARFRQINMDSAVSHHDALEFSDGQVVLLTRLCEGQRATVLQLPAAAHPVATKEAARPLPTRGAILEDRRSGRLLFSYPTFATKSANCGHSELKAIISSATKRSGVYGGSPARASASRRRILSSARLQAKRPSVYAVNDRCGLRAMACFPA